MDFSLREYKSSDLDELWKIDQQCFPPGIAYSKPEIDSYTRGRGVFTLIAQGSTQPDQQSIIGFIIAHYSRKGAGHVITIDVLETARRSGVGSCLLEAAEERLRREGCSNAGLETAVTNAAALKFYERHGYKVMKRIAKYYATGLDAFGLVKEL